ncbi:MAG TPA: SpoIIE family protein phosphatase [Hyphomicrobiaceae bacterium]|nr:SpoIIE family protein phosphatase [Hyphomicrobiaceae bacterium]
MGSKHLFRRCASGQLCLRHVFTDGVTEANNSAEEMFGSRDWKPSCAGAGRRSEEIVKTVAEAVHGFVGAALPFDDITMLAVPPP